MFPQKIIAKKRTKKSKKTKITRKKHIADPEKDCAESFGTTTKNFTKISLKEENSYCTFRKTFYNPATQKE